MEIRIVTMAEFHKNGSKEPFLWNCAAAAARINRKAVYSVDIILEHFTGKVKKRKRGFKKRLRLTGQRPGVSPAFHALYSSFRRLISVPFSSAPMMRMAALIYSQISSTMTVPMEPYSTE